MRSAMLLISFLYLNRFIADKEVQTTERVQLTVNTVNNEVSSTLTIDNCTVEDSAEVKVVAKNPAGEANSNAPFTVQST